ncbi:CLAVATA3/ESR-RELATED 25 [Euphorbia peplus]|nr:CLAVATA3/ESR-RELATED 25 [Euphorbia peplus]
MGRGCSVLRALFGAFLFVGVIWLLSVGTEARTRVLSNGKYEHWELNGRGRHHHRHHHQESEFNFVIKRRVPNGPDPIHNRRASQARQPPGRT